MYTKPATITMIVFIENTQIEKQKSAFNDHFKIYINIYSHPILNSFYTVL